MGEYSMEELREIAQIIKKEAKRNRSSLIKEKYDSDNPDERLDGLCYVVSEAMYHLTGGKSEWTPKQMRHEGVSHWFLLHKDTQTVFDLTENQFESPVPHQNARGRGFCTGKPSSRTSDLIQKVRSRIEA